MDFLRRIDLGEDDIVRLRLANAGVIGAEMGRGLGIDPDRHRLAAEALRRRLDRRRAGGILVLFAHRILQIEDDEVGIERARLFDRAWIGGGQEEQRAELPEARAVEWDHRSIPLGGDAVLTA